MIMSKENKIVEQKDLLPLDVYEKNRKKIRKELVEFKKIRRVSLGPYATFYFENFDTMLGQIQEMLYIEKGGDKQLKDELEAYNPLIPKGSELVATLMFEIDDPTLRADFLNKVGGIEKSAYLQIGQDRIKAKPEKDLDRTSAEGKASSVQFIHFDFLEDQILKIKDLNSKMILGIEHNLYNHITTISQETKKSLMSDFS